uniref:Uncharacterized protein n=1 Tax=Meloidogyne floridensis TaxID=298350 RepID=A0A915NX26_9BILA
MENEQIENLYIQLIFEKELNDPNFKEIYQKINLILFCENILKNKNKIKKELEKENKSLNNEIKNIEGFERDKNEWAILEGKKEYLEKIENKLNDFEEFYKNKLKEIEVIDWKLIINLMEFKQIFELFFDELIKNKLKNEEIIENKRLEIVEEKFKIYREEIEEEENLKEEKIEEKLKEISSKLDIELMNVEK